MINTTFWHVCLISYLIYKVNYTDVSIPLRRYWLISRKFHLKIMCKQPTCCWLIEVPFYSSGSIQKRWEKAPSMHVTCGDLNYLLQSHMRKICADRMIRSPLWLYPINTSDIAKVKPGRWSQMRDKKSSLLYWCVNILIALVSAVGKATIEESSESVDWNW